jgi:hypothetical protein
MEFALGLLHWTEAAFWATSLRAYDRAVAGHLKTLPGGSKPALMPRSRLEELKLQYPDTH